jgi:hypothetical protein
MRTIRLTAAASLMLVQLASANAASIITEWLDKVLPTAKEIAWEPANANAWVRSERHHL